MELFTRRLVAVAATSALVSVPAVALVASGGSASAASTTSGTARAAAACRVATPATLIDGLGDLLNNLTGALTGTPTGAPTGTPTSAPSGGTGTASGGVPTGSGGSGGGSTSTALDPLTALLAPLLPGSPTDAAGVTATLASILSALPPATQSIAETALGTLESGGTEGMTSALDQLQAILYLPVGLASLFPAGVPIEITGLLPGGLPGDETGLLAQLTTVLSGQGATSVPSSLAGKLPSSGLTALNDALSRAATPPATSGSASTGGACAVPPTTACRKATTRVKALQKRLKAAKHKHHRAQTKSLTTKLKHAKKAKKKAC